MEFKLNGKPLALTRETVIECVRGKTPGPSFKHEVLIEGVYWPIKDVFALATREDKLDFTTKQARKVLISLGFEVRRLA
mgnify:CR=1 FL=1